MEIRLCEIIELEYRRRYFNDTIKRRVFFFLLHAPLSNNLTDKAYATFHHSHNVLLNITNFFPRSILSLKRVTSRIVEKSVSQGNQKPKTSCCDRFFPPAMPTIETGEMMRLKTTVRSTFTNGDEQRCSAERIPRWPCRRTQTGTRFRAGRRTNSWKTRS